MAEIIESSMKDMDAPEIISQMTQQASLKMNDIIDRLASTNAKKRITNCEPPAMLLRNCRSNDRGVVKARATEMYE